MKLDYSQVEFLFFGSTLFHLEKMASAGSPAFFQAHGR